MQREEGWLMRHLEDTRKEIEDWPRWLIRAYGLDVPENTIERQGKRIAALEAAISDFLGLHCHEGWCDECCAQVGSEVYSEMFSYDPPRHREGCRTAGLQDALRGGSDGQADR